MATLHIMVGLPGSGKTTEATRLARGCHALRLTPDEWQYHLFGSDFNVTEDNTEHDLRHTKIEGLMWKTAKEVLRLGIDVILDFGFWSKEERDIMRAEAASLGVGFRMHYMECPKETLWVRIEKRNQQEGQFHIRKEDLDEWWAAFEAPSKEEIEGNL